MKSFTLKTASILALCASCSLLAPVYAADQADSKYDHKVLTVAASPIPAAEILGFMKPQLEQAGIDLHIKEYNNLLQPNQAVAQGNSDINCSQNLQQLQAFNGQRHVQLQAIGYVYDMPMAAYSKHVKSLQDLRQNAMVVIPNDMVSTSRALYLLQNAGMIKLRQNSGRYAVIKDVVENPKGLVFRPIASRMLPNSLQQADVAVMDSGSAMQGYMNPNQDAIFVEDEQTPYPILCATMPGKVHKDIIQRFMQAWHSDATKDFIQQKYHGSVIPLPADYQPQPVVSNHARSHQQIAQVAAQSQGQETASSTTVDHFSNSPNAQKLILQSDALFGFDKAQLTSAGQRRLQEIVQQLQGIQSLKHIDLTGYSDPIGDSHYNLQLSQQRAQAVKDYLVAQGITADLIAVTGKGASQPLAQCDHKSGEALKACLAPDRRVEIEVNARETASTPMQ
ncbi:MetQ/NlpA family ABC transporter substrate-binding protein [Brackiella oedipodis]|uniref:MetQ/NlpA family ABC transporter substrate-binding protein n=1 Tax=Brackiella oedipodis TaxID=124225 RepID=UPI000685BFDD|nr:MetQ/NlpA family ABC transporter substrate-binding protein [Brackiella oedipodis]